MAMKAELLDELIAQGEGNSGQWMLSEKGLMGELRLALAERLLRGELTHHLALTGRLGRLGHNRMCRSSAIVATVSRPRRCSASMAK